MKIIEPPTNCPECNSILVWKNDQLFCDSLDCDAKSLKALEHWSKTMKIKGLGSKTIEKLEINSLLDLYSLDEGFIKEALGSEKLATKLYNEIQVSKQVPLNTVLPAFGISLIGNSATEKLAKVIKHIDELTLEKAKQAGLGPKASSNLMEWFENKYLPQYKGVLPLNFSMKVAKSNTEKEKGTICITGKLKSFKTKAQAEEKLREVGFIVSSNFTSKVTHLVNESGIESAKTKKARESGVSIVENITQLIGELHNGKCTKMD